MVGLNLILEAIGNMRRLWIYEMGGGNTVLGESPHPYLNSALWSNL